MSAVEPEKPTGVGDETREGRRRVGRHTELLLILLPDLGALPRKKDAMKTCFGVL